MEGPDLFNSLSLQKDKPQYLNVLVLYFAVWTSLILLKDAFHILKSFCQRLELFSS